MMKEINEILELLNPWWKDGSVSRDLARPYKRRVFNRLLKLVDYRQIIILSGLRRVGKTTLLYQIIENLLKSSDPKHVLYFNLDKSAKDLKEILNAYEELVGVNWKKERIFVLIDEIAKLDSWGRKTKLIYDAFPNIKLIVSSSSSIGLEEEAVKNLAGRYFPTNIKPLSFVEFLELKERGELLKNPKLWEREIKREFDSYLLRNLPEIITWDDELLIKDYLRTMIIDKVVKQDIPERFRNVDRDLLLNLLSIFYSEPGIYLDYDSTSKKLRISKKTLIQHISYLEFSYLLRKIKNFRISTSTVSRKMQRLYPYWWTLAYCYGDNYNKIMENVVASSIDAKHYWRKNGKEIDFLVIDGKNILPIEVKNKKQLTKNDMKNMKYFLEKYRMEEGIIIYDGEESEEKFTNRRQGNQGFSARIRHIPLWKWLLEA